MGSPPETRASLILRLPNAADVAAWDEFVAVYRPLVFRAARRQGLQANDAEDLVQEVFSAVAKQIGGWLQRSDRGPFRAWLLRIARNIAVNLLTRKQHGATGYGGDDSECPLAEIPDRTVEGTSQFDLDYRREVFRWAAEQVQQSVAEKTWLAFYLTHVKGVSVADAARQLGTSVGNVYVVRSRIMNRLRELAEEFEDRE